MNREHVLTILNAVKNGELAPGEAISQIAAPFVDLTHTKFDSWREMRSGFQEVILGAGKDNHHLCEVVKASLADTGRVLVTRLEPAQFQFLQSRGLALQYHPLERIAVQFGGSSPAELGTVAIVSAGTSDAPAAAEAFLTAKFFALAPVQFCDVGVAGLQRLLSIAADLQEFDAVIVVAGMEGALPSVVAGLVPAPVIAVPTSTGYGACFGGVTALLSMLVSCSPGITVVNIDNGFGAALAAAKMLRHFRRRSSSEF